MKNRFDRAAKDALAEALAPMANVLTGLEASPDAQSIDVWSVPTAAPLADLRLAGADGARAMPHRAIFRHGEAR